VLVPWPDAIAAETREARAAMAQEPAVAMPGGVAA